MRELINLIENLSILTEKSRGLLFRAKGDRFFKGQRNNPESVLLFDRAEYYPQQPGNYETSEEMLTAFQTLAKKYIGIQAVNKPTSASKAFAVIVLTDEKLRKPVYFARFFSTIKPDMSGTWANSEMNAFDYQLEKETSLKASYGLKPSDLFPPPARFKNVNDVYASFKNSEKAQPFIAGLGMLFLPKPQLPVFQGASEFFTAIRDDLGETIGPIALVQGLNAGTGAKAADRDLLNGNGFGGSTISFPEGKINGLVDSYLLTPSGIEIGISSKGEKGATASIKNVSDGIKNIKEKGTDAQKQLLKKYEEEVKLIERIGTDTTIGFPLNYAIENQMLSNIGAETIKQLIKLGAKSLDQIEMDTTTADELSNLIGYKGAKTQLTNYNVGYHCLSAIAELVADKINSRPNFGEACLTFLNSSPIIQLHMSATKQKDNDVVVTGFTSKYPPNFRGTVALDASKNYSATAAGGRLNFAYDGVDADQDSEIGTSSSAMPDVVDVAPDITKPKSSKSTKDKIPEPGAGRAKRKK